ncbi:hypothetical protein ACFJGW_17585 [Burkholderiaceae bacterium UC74_6]
MPRPLIEPVSADTLGEFAAFLHEHLNPALSIEGWVKALSHHWGEEPRPNHGYVLRDEGRIVGGIGALYASRSIQGKLHKTCNITSWCVLDDYRKQSMRLAMALTDQPGWDYTDFSPTEVVGGVLRFLKFTPLDERQTVLLALPWLLAGGQSYSRQQDIESHLHGEALQQYRDHKDFPWLRHVIVGSGSDWCHVIYKRMDFKGLPAARVWHVSRPELLAQYWRRLANALLWQGFASIHLETRRAPADLWPTKVRSGFNAKVYRSDTLLPGEIDYLYSESMAMDL